MPVDCGTGKGGFKQGNTCGKRSAIRGTMVSAKRVGVGKDATIKLKSGKQAPEWIKPAMIPPAWVDVQVAIDPTAEVLVTARDAKGNVKTVYSDQYAMEMAAAKFSRVSELLDQRDEILSQVQLDTKSRDPEVRDNADATWLMMTQATRPGSDSDTTGLAALRDKPVTRKSVIGDAKRMSLRIEGKEVPIRDAGTRAEIAARVAGAGEMEDSTYWLKAHGATTLEARHVEIDGDATHLRFVGKEGVWHDHEVQDSKLAAMLRRRKREAEKRDGKTGRLFPAIDEEKAREYAASLGNGGFTPKDWRTSRATELAVQEVKAARQPKSMTKAEYKAAVMGVATKVSRLLGNKPAQALASYINPTVFAGWRKACRDCED